MTNFGRMLRKLRIDHNERLYDMALKLDVSSAFLSSVEFGRKGVPNGWVNKITTLYGLDASMYEELRRLADESTRAIRIDLSNASAKQRNVAMGFARHFNNFSDDTLDAFRKLLEKSNE